MAIWWPTFAFMCLGFDHMVANMFFVPIGICYDAPGLSTRFYIWKSMIPALIGNIVGGGLFVGVMYWYLVSLGGLRMYRGFQRTNSCDSTSPTTQLLCRSMASTSDLTMFLSWDSHLRRPSTFSRMRAYRHTRRVPRIWYE